MNQVTQSLRDGVIALGQTPGPVGTPTSLVIEARCSLVSAGTERMLVEFGRGSLFQKARSQPDRIRDVLNKSRTDGLMPTLEAVFRKLDEPLGLGYCHSGVVVDSRLQLGEFDIRVGDRVVSNGPHAEIVSVPSNLCAKIPDGVADEDAAFTVLGAIGLQGIRLAQPTLGERFLVVGLGLIGQITVQLLRAQGCYVLGSDLNPDRVNLARQFGAEVIPPGADPVAAAEAWTRGVGVDGVLITASAKSDNIVHQAAQACRKRGRIILVGVVGLNLRRDDFYKKELTFQVSCSYGPGRYDEEYEQRGHDYPLPYVRWTEKRNFEAVLACLESGQLNVKPLITHRFRIDNVLAAYKVIQDDPAALGVILEYPEHVDRATCIRIRGPAPVVPNSCPAASPVVGVIGVGNFAKAVLLPALTKTSAARSSVASRNPVQSAHAARKFGFEFATTDYQQILRDRAVNTVFILTGHDSHARLVCEALACGKHVFVEKPLALNEEELRQIEAILAVEGPSTNAGHVHGKATGCNSSAAATQVLGHLMVGFNRRFSPHTLKIKEWLIGRREPLCMHMTVNAGAIPVDHWTQNPGRGGGRIIGEACHFIDLLVHLASSPVISVSAVMIGEGPVVRSDKMSIQLSFADGSIGTVNYYANGSKSYPKELLEVFSDGRVVRMENFRVTTGFGFRGSRKFKTWRQDKGHNAEVEAFLGRITQGAGSPIPFAELANVTRATFAAMESAETGARLCVPFNT